MKKHVINAYLGGIVDFINIGQSETRNFYFEATQPLDGTFDFLLWNSDKKNQQFDIFPNAVTKLGNKLTLTVDASLWDLQPSKYYYEIVETTQKKIYFKGILEIID